MFVSEWYEEDYLDILRPPNISVVPIVSGLFDLEFCLMR